MRAPRQRHRSRPASPRPRTLRQKVFSVVSTVALLGYGLSVPPPAAAGGPLVVGGTFGVSGAPFTWDTDSTRPIRYSTDGGMLGSLTNDQANALVQSMFQVWQNVPTANLSFTRAGQIIDDTGTPIDVDSVQKFNSVRCASSGPRAGQNPIIYDADGTLFAALGFSSGVIGFAGPSLLSSNGTVNRITCARAALNGKFLIGSPPPLTQDQFAAAFIHEFGHFSGLDHSQINTNCQTNPSSCGPTSDDVLGLPTMYPILLNVFEPGGVPAQKTLAADDIAWISRLYPVPSPPPTGKIAFSTSHGTISGTVVFSDGVTQAQGVNVIARSTTAPRKNAVSVVSGYLYTGNRGQSVTGNNTNGSSFGSRNPQLAGTFDIPVPASPPTDYTVEVESIRSSFIGGSGVGPLPIPIPMPGTAPAPAGPFTVSAGATTAVPGVVLLSTPPRFDAFESAQISPPDPPPLWLRKESLQAEQEAA